MSGYSEWSDDDLNREVNRRTAEIESTSRAWQDRDATFGRQLMGTTDPGLKADIQKQWDKEKAERQPWLQKKGAELDQAIEERDRRENSRESQERDGRERERGRGGRGR